MADDDEAGEGLPFDPTFANAGPRRSTFTPPTGSVPAQADPASAPAARDAAELDDDALADALAADISRIATGVIPVSAPTPQPEPPPVSAVPAPVPAAETTPPPPFSVPSALDLEPPPIAASAAPDNAAGTGAAPPPWSTLPPPDPAQAVRLPDSVDPPSAPITLPNLSPVDPPSAPTTVPDPAPVDPSTSATLDAIERLQAELEERARGAMEQAAAAPQPEPLAPSQGPFISGEQVSAWPFPNFGDNAPSDEAQPAAAQPAAAPEAEPWQQEAATPRVEPFPEPQPWPQQAATPAGEPVFPPQPESWQQEIPTPAAESAPLPEPDPLPEAVAPPLPAWEVPAPSANWAPGPEYDDAEPAVASDAIAEPAVTSDAIAEPVDIPPAGGDAEVLEAEQRATAWEPQPWDPPPAGDDSRPFVDAPTEAADAVIEAELVEDEPPAASAEAPAYSPPPLVEPGQHGPPLLPSQAAGRPPLVISPDFGAPTAAPQGGTAEGDPGVAPGQATATGPAPASGPPPLVEPGSATPRPSSFDDLLTQSDAPEPADEEPQLYRDPEPAVGPPSQSIFIEPMPVAAGESVPTDTGSISIIDQAYDEELPDDVDETDRAVPVLGAVSVDTAGIAIVPGPIHPPSGPISTVRIPEDEVVLKSNEPVRMKVFSLEDGGLEATPVDHRVGRAARLFWLWFAANSSILSIGLGATVFAVGMSLRQSVVSVLAGVALSFIPLGLTTLAGKRSGQPTMVVSRATFGLVGNVIPALLALVTRVFWGAVLLWLLASSVAIILVGAALDGGFGDRQLLLISLAGAFLVALLVAFAGYPLFARIQLILSVISGILVVGLVAMTWKYVDIATALTTPDGSWALTITGTVLVFSFVGLVWANSGADLARYQRPGSSGAASMLWATVGTTLPTFVLIAYGALLAASDKGIATGFIASPLDTLSIMLPNWYPVPLLAATALSLLSGVILTLYSGGFALQAIGVRVRRQWSIVIVAVLLAGLALLLTFGVSGGMTELFRDVATTIAVPTAAWAGIFAAEMMIRNRRFETQSLLVRGGIYPNVRWVNFLALLLITAVGFGLTTATVGWLSWQGYGFTLLGMPLDGDLAASDLGVLVALVLGLLVPLVAGVPAIRKQEALRPGA